MSCVCSLGFDVKRDRVPGRSVHNYSARRAGSGGWRAGELARLAAGSGRRWRTGLGAGGPVLLAPSVRADQLASSNSTALRIVAFNTS
eukprot:1160451-Pelagomonas_calceolata.AAC.18